MLHTSGTKVPKGATRSEYLARFWASLASRICEECWRTGVEDRHVSEEVLAPDTLGVGNSNVSACVQGNDGGGANDGVEGSGQEQRLLDDGFATTLFEVCHPSLDACAVPLPHPVPGLALQCVVEVVLVTAAGAVGGEGVREGHSVAEGDRVAERGTVEGKAEGVEGDEG
jgi:hypothetical protein